MKHFKFIISLACISALLFMVSCNKDFKKYYVEDSDLQNTSQVQVFVATVGAQRSMILVDGQRVSRGTLSAGTSFPTANYPSTNTGYAFTVTPGVRLFTVMDTILTSAQRPLTFSHSFEAGKLYTIFTYDSLVSPKQVTVETNIEIPTDNTARLRFANMIHDLNDVPPVEVFSRRRNEVIFSNVAKTQVTNFIPYSSTVNDTLVIRNVGSTTALAQFNGFLPTQKRSYTLVYRGSHRGTKAATVFANY